MYKTTRVFFLIIFLLSCSSTSNKPNIASEFNIADAQNTGVLLASVTYSGTFSGYSVFYRKIGSDKYSKMTIGGGTALLPPSMWDWDIDEPGLRGNVFAIELQAGEYEFYNWTVSSGMAFVKSNVPFSVKFNIDPGKATYVGNITFKRTHGFGATVTGVDVVNEDKRSQDLPIFMSKYPNLNYGQINYSIAENKNL